MISHLLYITSYFQSPQYLTLRNGKVSLSTNTRITDYASSLSIINSIYKPFISIQFRTFTKSPI